MADPAECTAFNKGRYLWVKKRIERTETVADIRVHAVQTGASPAPDDPEEVVVYSIGTLYGE